MNMDMIMACVKFGDIIKKLCQGILNGENMPEEWKTMLLFQSLKERGL